MLWWSQMFSILCLEAFDKLNHSLCTPLPLRQPAARYKASCCQMAGQVSTCLCRCQTDIRLQTEVVGEAGLRMIAATPLPEDS